MSQQFIVTAQPIKWEAHPSGQQWTEDRYGYCITTEFEELPATPYVATLGEGDPEWFGTLEEAQAWCQRDIDAWVAKHAVVAAPPPQAAQPLTEEQLSVAVEVYGPQSEDEETGFRDGWRAAERAHNIGAAPPATQAAEEVGRDAARWRALYLRAVNEANGLTNYVEDRPELRRAERNLTAIEAEARALDAAMSAQAEGSAK